MEIDFDKYKALQYCMNEHCVHYQQIGLGNIGTSSRKNNQVYCSGCKKRWVLTQDTFFYDLRREKTIIMTVLLDLSEGKGHRAIYRTTKVSPDTQTRWILRASSHVEEINVYLEQEMHLSRVQIDEFWSFIYKKRESYRRRAED